MFNIVKDLFGDSGFMPRYACGPGWTANLTTLSMIGNLTIGLSYMAIPLLLIWIYRLYQSHRINVSVLAFYRYPLLVMFVLFILLCGGTHFNEIVVFSHPAYRYFTLCTFMTGVVSFATVLSMARVVGLATLPVPAKDQP